MVPARRGISEPLAVYPELEPSLARPGRTEVGSPVLAGPADQRRSDAICPGRPRIGTGPAISGHQIPQDLADGRRGPNGVRPLEVPGGIGLHRNKDEAGRNCGTPYSQAFSTRHSTT